MLGILGRVLLWALALLGALVIAVLVFVYIQGTHRPSARAQYVALGSSFASGPGIGEHAADSPLLCMQSASDYAHQLASKRGLSLADVTCSGATTHNILEQGQFFAPAQIEAVTSDTELVTITIGGNDVNYMRNAIALSQPVQPGWMRVIIPGPASDAAVEAGFARLQSRLERIVGEVRRRAPNARVVFVPYFSVLPASGTCARLALSEASADRLRAVAARLNQITVQAAHEAGAEVFDLAGYSRDHDACGEAPWVMGASATEYAGAPLHPNLDGMTAAADALDRFLDQTAS